MKFNLDTIIFLFVALSLIRCSSGEGEGSKKQNKVMYHAVYKNDTAKLNLDLDKTAFTGQLEINYNGLFKDSGDVNGIIKGDTLKGTYYYQHYGIEHKERIPIALLRKKNKLIMGVGEMEIYMNMTFFKKTVPIDYQNVKFIFEKAP